LLLFCLSTTPWKSDRRTVVPHILNLGARWRWSTSRPDCFAAAKYTSVTHLMGTGWPPESLRTSLEEGKSLAPTGNRPLFPPLSQPVAQSLHWLRYPGSLILTSAVIRFSLQETVKSRNSFYSAAPLRRNTELLGQ